MKCTCKLKLKNGFNIIMESPFLSRPVHLGKISSAEYDFYADIFPEAFEKDCKCNKDETYKLNGTSKKK